jgi:hypothetical protein
MQKAKPVLRRPRRVVTGHDADGRSIFLQDGPAPNLIQPEHSPNVGMFNLWQMAAVPCSYAGDTDAASADAAITLVPPVGGLVFRFLEFPPDAERNYKAQGEVFKAYGNPEAITAGDQRHPGFHKTSTVDFGIVLEGEIWALMDVGEKLLHPGDVVIQRGTNHAWANRSDKPARMAFILISAEAV